MTNNINNESLEIVVYTDLAQTIPGKIDFNFDELKQKLTSELDKYNGLVVTEDSVGLAKKDRAKLNNLKKAIDEKRKEVKRDYSKPLNDFEAEIKTLINLIDKPVEAIDLQIKSYEAISREKRVEEIKAFYDDNIGEIGLIIPFERLYEKEWSNISFKDWKEFLEYKINRVRTDLSTIEGLNSKYKNQMTDKYLLTFDLSMAIGEQKRLEEQEAKLKLIEEQRQSAEEFEKPTPIAQPITHSKPKGCKKIYNYELRMTDSERTLLENFLFENGVDFVELDEIEGF